MVSIKGHGTIVGDKRAMESHVLEEPLRMGEKINIKIISNSIETNKHKSEFDYRD